jgi:hypothetical protein
LTSALALLTTTVRAGTDPVLSVLKLPLQQCGVLCGKAFKDFDQPESLPSKLTVLDYEINDFADILARYESTFKVVHSDTNL